MRRIHYKIHVLGPEREQYEEIFRRCCAERGIDYVPAAVGQIYREFYGRLGLEPRACHPRDVLDHLLDFARFQDVPSVLTPDLLDRACNTYFVDL